jgi:SAM-dependent methyltransferase
MAKSIRNLLIYHIMDREIEASARKYLKGRLIDIGCGTKPYRSMFAPYVAEHIGLDRDSPFNAQADVDLVGTAYDIPVEAESFDSAVSTATLEHLSEPEAALKECHRVLKAGGVAIYTVPLIWHLHAEPWDFYRFTKYGLKHLFEKAGFEVLEIKPLAGFWVTMAQLTVYYLFRFHRGPWRFLKVIPVLGLLIQLLGFCLDKLDRAEEWTWMYLLVARKPLAPVATV